ncbi:hypothetical protein [Treponema sp.]|uniref:hypothetical protein n=1 Tax=Treponema sp. TaxID=166 RepID=UPI00298E847D|nr:hypothetical protein [Treponema sp.]MCR5613159.1 hypothetical protein [Treponema sp.]
MNFKKGLLFAVVCAVLSLSAFAQENKGGHTKADITYQTAPIYKVLDSSDAYVVLYGKNGAKIGTLTIPKKWAKWQKDTPRKLSIRELPPKMSPFITIVKKDNKFLKVILTIPTNKLNAVWGVANANHVDSSDPGSLELELR